MTPLKFLIAAAMVSLLSACGGGGGSGCSALGALANCGSESSSAPAAPAAPGAGAVVSNVAPVANAGPYQSVLLGSNGSVEVALDGSASTDANRDVLTYKWTLKEKPAGSLAAFTEAESTSVKPKFTADKVGAYVATLVVTESTDAKLTSPADKPASVTVLVSQVNAPPVANAGPNQDVRINTDVTLDGFASSDANGQPLTYKWTIKKPDGSAGAFTPSASATSMRPTFKPDAVGTYEATLVVNDTFVDSVPDTVLIAVAATNVKPTAVAGPDQSVLLNAVVQLSSAGSSDPNGDRMNFSWALVAKPTGSTATLSAATSESPTFTADKEGFYVATLIVNDGSLYSDSKAVVVTAAELNVRPVANAGPAQAPLRVGGTVTVTLAGSATDTNAKDILTYRWALTSQPPTSVATLSATNVAAPTFTATVAGVYVATLIVSDGKLDSLPATVVITVGGT